MPRADDLSPEIYENLRVPTCPIWLLPRVCEYWLGRVWGADPIYAYEQVGRCADRVEYEKWIAGIKTRTHPKKFKKLSKLLADQFSAREKEWEAYCSGDGAYREEVARRWEEQQKLGRD